jgi:hypothetical protein
MSGYGEPRGPFAFHEDEAYLGEGALWRTPRRRLATLLGLVLLALVTLAALALPRLLASRGLDPSVNLQTGLPDGRYALIPDRSMHDGAACWFTGAVRGHPRAAEITLYGTGDVQCARVGDHIGRVLFTVTNGTARIMRAAGY